jgi:hypothetical protein
MGVELGPILQSFLSSIATGLSTTEALMILKVTVLKGSVDIFSVNIDVRQPSELSTGVKATLDEFRRVSPKTSLLDGAQRHRRVSARRSRSARSLPSWCLEDLQL